VFCFLFLCVAATVSTNFPLGINKVYIYLSIYLNPPWGGGEDIRQVAWMN